MRYFFGFLVLCSSSALADNSVNVQLFRSPFNLNYGMTESAIHDNAPWEVHSFAPHYFAGADYHYVKDPLVVIDTTTNTRVRTLVNSVHTLDLGGGYFVNPGLSIYAQVPIDYTNIDGAGSQLGLADSRLAAKIALNDVSAPLNFALMAELDVPTGSKTRFTSDAGIGAGLLLIAENDFGSFRMTGNVGLRYSPNAQFTGIDYRKRIPIGLGVAIPITRKWVFNVEGNGALAFPTSQKQNASEFYGGLNYAQKKYLNWLFGAAIGAFNQSGSAEYRLQAAVRMYFDQKQKDVDRYEQPAPAPVAVAPRHFPKQAARMTEDRIEILEEIQFDNNQDTLKKRGKEILDQVAELIREHEAAIDNIEVEGHTSHTGTYKHNMDLSWRRARTVVGYLVHQQKIPAPLLKARGYGYTKPKFQLGKATRAQLEQNRRVEFQVSRKAK
jgi:outer membrane protein OmpA-like peptidoglycan-associated protein